MKYFTLTIISLCFYTFSFSQKDMPVEVTPAIEKKINKEVVKEIDQLKVKLSKQNDFPIANEFTIDTFRINLYQQKYMEYDWSTAGMRKATYDAANKYDSLLNKYYKKLMTILKSNDKTTLVNTQKSWITFRDNELKLIQTISKDEYSGGGTMQQLIDASSYLEIITQRAITLYQYYDRASQGL
ncbi:MAG: hypothetical protein DI598_04655 [Pseudopedobacter saltans]|uniref:Lysozyme inhibitor LprI-like N-terminal domain-containing protein n=1 Tax=Pseudopedobacter saltans TaxID=151895 RepID=A0A2W5HAT3_9SPHI|nr:MAG: hypothetical protein DI598_04655 [Pseudopedobacter saltans]